MNNNTVAREVFERFSGLDLSSARGKGAHRLDNFRVLADGSLEKREGLGQVAALPDAVRGIYSFADGEQTVILAAAGKNLYRISPASEQVTFSSCFETKDTAVSFFEYGGRLYILDGAQLYRYEGGAEAVRVRGYTPLYGKDWDPLFGYLNSANEPINLLSPRIRIHFSIKESTDYLQIGMAVKGVEWVRVGSRLLDASEYSLFSYSKDRIYFSTPILETTAEICVLLEESYYLDSAFSSSIKAAVYDDFDNSRVFLYGGEQPSRLYMSSPVSTEVLKRDKELFPDSCGLYFPKGQQLCFGDKQPITAVGRVYDRMMIFFPSSLWVTERLREVEGYDVKMTPICHHMGCSAMGAMLLTGTASPISVTGSGVYRWRIDVDLLDECVATKISEGVRALTDESFLENAEVCHNRRRAELWFRDRSRRDGRILVYDLEHEHWFCYSGFEADQMFAFGTGVGLVLGGGVFLFDERRKTDRYTDGERVIEAVFESGWLDFDGVGTEKRLACATLTAAIEGGELLLCIEEGTDLAKTRVKAADAAAPDVYELRMPTGRFRTARLTLVAGGKARQRIYRAELLAQKGKQ